jgi:hypothetical protein
MVYGFALGFAAGDKIQIVSGKSVHGPAVLPGAESFPPAFGRAGEF